MKIKYLVLLIVISIFSCSFAQKILTYPELSKLVINNYSQITQLELTGYCGLSIYQQFNNSWQYQEDPTSYYGFNQDSAYFIKHMGYGTDSSRCFLTDKKKIVQYYLVNSGGNSLGNGEYSRYKTFPPELAMNNLLPFDLFERKYQLSFNKDSVSVETTDNLYKIEGVTKQNSKVVIYVDPQYNYSIVRKKIDSPGFHLEYVYDDFDSSNGVFFPRKAAQFVLGNSLETTMIVTAHLDEVRVNNFQNYDYLRNRLNEGEMVFDTSYGVKGFRYQYSTTLSENSITQMADKYNRSIAKEEKKSIPPKKSYWFYGGILFLIGGVFLASSRLLRKK
jgi:hypothetical protein